jgi:hypothetical protein
VIYLHLDAIDDAASLVFSEFHAIVADSEVSTARL